MVACLPVATGWLYLLRDAGVLDLGPDVRGALPLQQLAGSDGQPLLRLLLVWIPAGALAAAALTTSRLRPARRVLAVAGVAAVVLFLAGAVSDAAAISDPVPSHLAAQLTRPGTLVAVALIAVGAAATIVLRSPRMMPPGKRASRLA